MIDWNEEKAGKDGEVCVFALRGQLDTEACDFLYTVLQDRIEDGTKKLILDCRSLEIISSMGLGMLMRLHTRMKKQGGDVKLARVHGAVAEVMKLVMLDRVFHFYASVSEAIESYPQ
jgi:anti-sigma B factor antagonist